MVRRHNALTIVLLCVPATVWFGPLPPTKIWQIVESVPPHPLKRGDDLPGPSCVQTTGSAHLLPFQKYWRSGSFGVDIYIYIVA